MGLSLPLELQQGVFEFLDPRTFYASRNVCRWWNVASKDSVTLSRQLQQLPIEPAVLTAKTGAERLHSLYNEAAQTLMLGARVHTKDDDLCNLSQTICKPKLAISHDQKRAVALDGRQITVHDLARPDCPVIHERPLNDLRTAIGGGPWFKCAPTSVYELALSSNGNLLAIALERTIQIYDLNAEADAWPVGSYISSASGHFIAGLQFAHNDSLLRVELSNKGTVLYLGTPRDIPADLQHWQEKGGLRHAYLDSSKLGIQRPSPVNTERLSGLQLLRPFEGGWLFAAQKHGGGDPATYCIGHVRDGGPHSLVATTPTTVKILALLSSAQSAISLPESARSAWGHLPSAIEQHPRFLLSEDGQHLTLAETLQPRLPATRLNTIFMYCVPSLTKLAFDLQRSDDRSTEEKAGWPSNEYTIHRFPLKLGEIKGRVLDFSLGQSVSLEKSLSMQVVTELSTKTWSLRGC